VACKKESLGKGHRRDEKEKKIGEERAGVQDSKTDEFAEKRSILNQVKKRSDKIYSDSSQV